MPMTLTKLCRTTPGLLPWRILRYLATHPGPTHYRVMAQTLTRPYSQIATCCARMAEDGRLTRTGHGMYAATDEG